MLVALLQTQVAEHWSMLRDHIDDSLPPIADYGPADMNNILHVLMIGGAVCWLVQDHERNTLGFMITTTLRDMSGVKTLLVYCAVVLVNSPSEYWLECIEPLKIYARDKSCAKIVCFVKNEKLIQLLKENGVDTGTVFATYRL